VQWFWCTLRGWNLMTGLVEKCSSTWQTCESDTVKLCEIILKNRCIHTCL
jgi:hypothetical protein